MAARPENYYAYAGLVRQLNAESHYTDDKESQSAALTDEGAREIEEWTGIDHAHEVERTVAAQMVIERR